MAGIGDAPESAGLAGSTYEDMLRQNADLQRDLANTVVIVEQMRDEIDSYRANFETLKVAHSRSVDANNDLKRQVIEANEGKSLLERNHEELVKQWKIMLDSKTREFEDMRSKLVPPREVELLRVKLLEELEGPYQLKYRALEQEITKYRNMYHGLAREHELHRTQSEQQGIESRKVMEELGLQHEAAISEMADRLRKLQGAVETDFDEDKVRQLEKSTAELELRNRQLSLELEEVRSHREKARGELDDHAHVHTQELAEISAKYKAALADRDTLNRRVAFLESELHAAQRDHDTSHTSSVRAQKENASLHAQLEDATADNTSLRAKVSELERTVERERQETTRHIADLQRQLNDVKVLHEDTLTTMNQRDREATLAQRRANEEHYEKVRTLEFEKMKLQNQLEIVEATQASAQTGSSEEAFRYQKEVSLLNTEKAALSMDNAALQDRIAELQNSLSNIQVEHDAQLQRFSEVTRDLRQSEDNQRDAQQRAEQSQAAREQLVLTIEYLKKDAEQREAELDATRYEARQDVVRLQKGMAKLAKKHAKHKEKLFSELRLSHNELTRLHGVIRSSKTKYETKLAASRRSIADLEGELARQVQVQGENAAALSSENRQTTRRLREAERRREELQLLMSAKIGGGGGGGVPASGGEEDVLAELSQQTSKLQDMGQRLAPLTKRPR